MITTIIPTKLPLKKVPTVMMQMKVVMKVQRLG
jgi:hypothetical protein